MSCIDLKKYIISKSKEIGIDIVGFTEGKSFGNLRHFLENRFTNNYHTEFEEENINLRINPDKTLTGVKSIIAIGLSYNLGYKGPSLNKEMLRLSKSSWGIDYHYVLRNKLNKLIDDIKKIRDFNYEICVDTSPLIDREIAKRSGIGWYGKNNSIINDKFGSFIFIGYILTSLDLEGDNSQYEKCGDCRLCIESCPTSAIKEGNVINSKVCISYLTQTKNKIPYELRSKMGTKVYGCDTCQDVCPKNKDVTLGTTSEFIPKESKGYMEIKELFKMNNREFKEKYKHMSGSWRGKNTLKRNAIIGLGNIGSYKYVDLLVDSLNDDSPLIREYSGWALLKIDKDLGYKHIANRLKIEDDNNIKSEFINLLKYFKVINDEDRDNI